MNLPFGTLARPNLLDIVDRLADVRLLLVHAPAGFGKTTLLRQIRQKLADQGTDTIWLTLTEADNDLGHFLGNLNTELDSVQKSSSPNSKYQDTEHNENTDERVMSTVTRINRLGAPVIAFFDEFEVLHSKTVLAEIARRIEGLPEDACLVIGSRNIPSLNIPKLRARGLMIEIDADQLRFSTEECQTFLAPLKLKEEQVSTLYGQTEGWPTALRLASLSLERQKDPQKFLDSFTGSSRTVSDYLADDVLAGLPEDLSTFLLESSVLNELTPALCDSICGRSNSAALLDQVHTRQLFLQSLDENAPRFRYHGLFQEFLLEQLQSNTPSRYIQLNQNASKAYLEADDFPKAIHHALVADDVDLCVSLLEASIDELLKQGRLRMLGSLLARLPKTAFSQAPHLKVVQAWCSTLTDGAASAEPLIAALKAESLSKRANQWLQALEPLQLALADCVEEAQAAGIKALPDASPNEPFAFAMLHQALCQVDIILGEHSRARKHIDEARKHQTQTTGSLGQSFGESAHALLELMTGQLQQANARLQMAIETSTVGRISPLTNVEYAETLYEKGQLEESQNLLATYGSQLGDGGSPDAIITVYVLQARIADSLGNRDKALYLLSQLEAVGHRLNLLRLVASARLERANRCLQRADNAGALQHLSHADESFEWDAITDRWHSANDTLYPELVRYRYGIQAGKAVEQIKPLKAALATAEKQNRQRRALKLRILLAEAQARNNEQNVALRTIKVALEFSEQQGFVQTFAEESATLQQLVRTARGGTQENAANSSFNEEDRHANNESLPEPLSPKEMRVLEVLAEGLSNGQIAEKLFVSDSTVRSHLRNINLKLQASNRTQAIAIGRQLGLIR